MLAFYCLTANGHPDVHAQLQISSRSVAKFFNQSSLNNIVLNPETRSALQLKKPIEGGMQFQCQISGCARAGVSAAEAHAPSSGSRSRCVAQLQLLNGLGSGSAWYFKETLPGLVRYRQGFEMIEKFLCGVSLISFSNSAFQKEAQDICFSKGTEFSGIQKLQSQMSTSSSLPFVIS